jgi:hypothetical protein
VEVTSSCNYLVPTPSRSHLIRLGKTAWGRQGVGPSSLNITSSPAATRSKRCICLQVFSPVAVEVSPVITPVGIGNFTGLVVVTGVATAVSPVVETAAFTFPSPAHAPNLLLMHSASFRKEYVCHTLSLRANRIHLNSCSIHNPSGLIILADRCIFYFHISAYLQRCNVCCSPSSCNGQRL